MRDVLYFTLIVIYLPMLFLVLRKGFIFKCPFFSSYFFSVFFLNVVGSCVVFFPALNIYGGKDIFTFEFFLILFLQAWFFYLFFPFFSIIRQARHNTLNSDVKTANRTIVNSLLLAFFIVIIFYKLYGLPPIYTSDIAGGNSTLMLARVDFFSSVSRVWFFRIGFYVLPQIAGILAFLSYKKEASKMSLLLFVVIAGAASILALSFLHKTPVTIFWISIFLAKVLSEKEVKFVLLLKWISLVFVLIFVWYLVYFPGRDSDYYFGFMVRSILNRIFGSYPLGLATVFPIVEEYGFFGGTTMNNPMGILPYEISNLAQMVHWNLFQIEGSHPPPAIGYAYADFGWIGVVVTLLFVNVVLFVSQILVNSVKNQLFYIALTSYLSLRVIFLSMSSASEILLNPGELITLVFILIAYSFSFIRVARC